jgi:hypothetical protein
VAAREALAANAAPLLTLEALALALRDPDGEVAAAVRPPR